MLDTGLLRKWPGRLVEPLCSENSGTFDNLTFGGRAPELIH